MTLSNRLKHALLTTTLITSCICTLPLATSASAAELKTVASIKPLHSLLAGVTKGVSTPKLLVTGNASPHDFALKPSQVKSIEEADLILMVDDHLERFLERPIESLHKEKATIEVQELDGLVKHDVREGNGFEKHVHDHEDKDHDHHKDHDHDKEHDHDKDHAKHDDDHKDHDHDKDDHEKEHAKHDDDHKDHDHDKEHDHDKDHAKHDDDLKDHDHDHDKKDDHDDHGDQETDSHFWLDPMNAKVIVKSLQNRLSKLDPENAKTYEKNAVEISTKLDALDQSIKADLVDIKGQNFIVFHDAYQYFENRYGIEASGSVTLSPELPANAARMTDLQKTIKDKNIKCIFTEPQFNKKSIDAITEGSDVKVAELDPLGGSVEAGEEQYFSLLKNLATSFKNCLK